MLSPETTGATDELLHWKFKCTSSGATGAEGVNAM